MITPTLCARAGEQPERLALVGPDATATYGQLLDASARTATALLDGRADLDQARVVFLLPPGVRHVEVQWSIWRAGGIAVPLSASQAPAEWDYVVADTGAAVVVGDDSTSELRSTAAARGARFVDAGQLDPEFASVDDPDGDSAAARPPTPQSRQRLCFGGDPSPRPLRHRQFNRTLVVSESEQALRPLPAIDRDRGAMILYTSGTTSRPKGVVTTHRNLEAQYATLVAAWGWTAADRILHVLPLNHVHGIVNILGCALWAGAVCEFLSPFDPAAVWNRMAAGGITVFMAVPTIYARMSAAWDAAGEGVRARWSQAARGLRLMVSGSAALPVPLLERWRAATGHVLLERYGMTEIGMALSNPLEGERRPGSVGVPLPGVDVRLVDEHGVGVPDGAPGEIEVRGESVFREYWGRPDATQEAFRDGWFRTGDVAVVDDASYRILGRQSVDIIKTGGYKVSALEIEDGLRGHPDVRDCAVVGVPDDEWGERVAAAIVPRSEVGPALEDLREWARTRLAKYKLPTRMRLVGELPRNAMGKVVKARVKELF